MENVFRLSEYRRRRAVRAKPPAASPGPQYFCTRCDADEFRLHATGKIHCAHCGAMMRNISVTP